MVRLSLFSQLYRKSICAQDALPPGCDALFELEEIPAECIGSATTIEEGFPILADYYCGAP